MLSPGSGCSSPFLPDGCHVLDGCGSLLHVSGPGESI